MNLKISLGAAIAFMAIVAAAAVSITAMVTLRSFNQRVSDLQQREERYGQIAQLDELVRENYLGEVGQDALMSAIAEGFLAGVGDPYAEFLDKAQYARSLNETSGRIVQVGLVTTMDESGYMAVTQVYPDSPAQAAEITVGDLIVKVDDLDVTKENYTQAAAGLRGEPGTKLTLTLRRETDDREIDLTRRFVETPSMTTELLENNIGLVSFTEFNTATGDQFVRQVDNLAANGAVALVLDVRGVQKASVDAVGAVLDKLVGEGPMIYMMSKGGQRSTLKTSDARSVSLPMVVLTDNKTTGEAELFAAVLKDFGAARLVGTKTAGKATVQTLLPLRDGSGAIRMTTAMYLPPSAVSFNGEGLKPDFEVAMTDDQITLAKVDKTYDLQFAKALEVVMTASRTTANQSAAETESSSSETESTASSGEATSTSEISSTATSASESSSSTAESASESSSEAA